MKARKWMGSAPTRCGLCGGAVREEFVDGRTAIGPWAIMCPGCHGKHGVGLGTGRGQRYERQPDGSYLKVEG